MPIQYHLQFHIGIDFLIPPPSTIGNLILLDYLYSRGQQTTIELLLYIQSFAASKLRIHNTCN